MHAAFTVLCTFELPVRFREALESAGLTVVRAPLDGASVSSGDGSSTSAGDVAREEVCALLCLLTDRVDHGVLASFPALRHVAVVAAGYDNVDVAAARDAGILVTNTPGVLAESTADLTLALMLAVARRLTEGDTLLREGGYHGWELYPDFIGRDIHGATLGIFGLGEIGAAVARRAVGGFGMRVIYHSRTRRDPEQDRADGLDYVEFDELLRSSDVLSLHAPLTPETERRFGREELRRMKRSAILVNTARGRLVVEEDLAAALEEGELWGAGLDVFEDEPAVHPRLLALRERVVLAPHVGSATMATRDRMVEIAVSSVLDVARGRLPETTVTGA